MDRPLAPVVALTLLLTFLIALRAWRRTFWDINTPVLNVLIVVSTACLAVFIALAVLCG
jgi:hypothetical protein